MQHDPVTKHVDRFYTASFALVIGLGLYCLWRLLAASTLFPDGTMGASGSNALRPSSLQEDATYLVVEHSGHSAVLPYAELGDCVRSAPLYGGSCISGTEAIRRFGNNRLRAAT